MPCCLLPEHVGPLFGEVVQSCAAKHHHCLGKVLTIKGAGESLGLPGVHSTSKDHTWQASARARGQVCAHRQLWTSGRLLAGSAAGGTTVLTGFAQLTIVVTMLLPAPHVEVCQSGNLPRLDCSECMLLLPVACCMCTDAQLSCVAVGDCLPCSYG